MEQDLYGLDALLDAKTKDVEAPKK